MFENKKANKVIVKQFHADADDAEWINSISEKTGSHAVTMRGLIKAARKYIEENGVSDDE